MTQKGESVTLTLYSSPKGRYHNPQPEGLLPPERKRAQPFYTTRGGAAPFFLHDDRGARCHRHLERRYVPLWETDRNRSHDALSREISHRNAARTIRGGDFSTPLRFGRNDGGRGPAFFKSAPEGRHYNPRPERPSNLRTLRTLGTKSRQPSRRRRVL